MAKDNQKTPGADPHGPPLPPETNNPIEPQLTPEQQAEVARLASSIAETETGPEEQGTAAPAAEIPAGSYDDDAEMAVEIFVESAIAYCPQVAPLWPADKRAKVSQALARVFQKYNFSFARFGPEIALIAVAGPALWQTSKVIALQMNAQAAQASAPEQVRAPVPHPGEPVPG